jgi:hypothetical protein
VPSCYVIEPLVLQPQMLKDSRSIGPEVAVEICR